MINSITNSNPASNSLTGGKQPNIKSDINSKKPETDGELLKENDVTNSDYPIDVFEDKNIVTAVACISKENQGNDKEPIKTMMTYEVNDSENELHQLENALYNQISTGTFQKRLKIKKLTLTPKHSIQESFVLNSGDTDTLLVKSTLSRKLELSETDMSELKAIPVLSNMIIHRTFPIQVSTVGYAFLKHYDHSISKHTGNDIVNLKDKSSKMNCIKHHSPKIIELCHKSFQCNMKLDAELKSNNRNVLELTNEKYVGPEPSKVDCSSEITETIFKDHLKMKDLTLDDKYKDTTSNIIAKSDNISTSTSLDILVGLLNEIKKITSNHANFVKHSNDINMNSKNKELEILLNNVPMENSCDNSSSVSLTSLASKDQDPKNLSLLLNDDGNQLGCLELAKMPTDNRNLLDNVKRICFDKEITVKISQTEFKHTFTDVPSQFLITTVNKSTDFLNSLTSTEKRCSRSVATLYDCSLLQFNSPIHKVTDLPKSSQEISVYNVPITPIVDENKYAKNNDCIMKKIIKADNIIDNIPFSDFDSTMKMKRDILVTIYYILVLTVFTALTFPDLLAAV